MVAADRARRSEGPSPAGLAIGALVLVGLGLVGWLAFFAPDGGGEPVVIAEIPPEPGAGVESTDLEFRATVPPERVLPGEEPEGGADDVRIIDATGDGDASGVPVKLARAPVDGLAEPSEYGLLPRIAPDGRRPIDVYARPAPEIAANPGAPVQIALIVTGLGISASGTDDAINRLPGEVTLAFAPYGSDLQTWVDRARSDGHEVMLQLPMEPFDYPDNDPGPHTLLSSLNADDNLDRLRWLLGRFSGYFAVTNYMGAKLTAEPAALSPVIAEIAARGLGYIDDGASVRSQAPDIAEDAGARSARADVAIAADENREGISRALAALETLAKERGNAVGVATALPVTIETVGEWARDLRQRGIILVPASALTTHGTI